MLIIPDKTIKNVQRHFDYMQIIVQRQIECQREIQNMNYNPPEWLAEKRNKLMAEFDFAKQKFKKSCEDCPNVDFLELHTFR